MKTQPKYTVTKIPDQDGLLQILVYDSEIQDYRTMAFDVTPQDASKIVKALSCYERKRA